MFAAAFFDEMTKLAKDDFTKGERFAADLSLLANGVGFGSAGTALYQNRHKGFVKAVGHIPVGSTIANLAGVALGTGALYHRKKRLEKEKEEQHKHAASSCHSAYTPRKRSGKPRAPRRVSLLHSAN